MPPEKGDPAWLFDMLEAAEDVVRFIGSKTIAHYSVDDLLRAAVERKIEIIGEAARNISKAFKIKILIFPGSISPRRVMC